MKRKADNPTAPVNDMNRAGSVVCKNEAKFRQIFESEPECVKLLGPDGALLEMNPAGLAMIEADSFEQVAGKSLFPIIAEEYRPAFSDLSKRVFAGGSGVLEFEIDGFKGGRRWLETHASPLRDSSGSITSLLGVTRDITERKRAGESLGKSEAYNRAIVESSLNCLVLIDHEGRINEFNPSAERTFGYTRAEALGQEIDELIIPPAFREDHRRGLERYLATGEGPVVGKRLEMTAIRKNGEEFSIELTIARIAGIEPPMFTGSIRDITDRKIAETAMRANEERLQNIFDGMSVFVGVISTDGRLNEVNQSAAAVGGLPREALIGMYLVDTPWFADSPGSKKQLLHMLQIAAGGTVVREEMVIHAANSGQITTDVTFSPLTDEAGRVTQIIASGVDVTERKRAEEALAASERKHRDIFTLAPVGIYQCRRDGTLITANNALAETLGYSSVEELLAVNIADFYLLTGQREELICKYENSGSAIDSELQWKRKDGSPIWIQLTSQAIKGAGGETGYFEGFVLDITERKKAEAYLHESEDRYRQLFDRNLAGVYRSTLDGRALECNDAFVNMYGYASKQEMLARPASDFYPSPAHREQHLAELHEKRELTNSEIEQRRKDGSVMWCIENVALTREADGTETIHGTIIDITERKMADEELRRSREQLAGVIGSAMDAIISIDEDHRIFLFNTAAEKMFLISSAEAIGMPLERLIPERFRLGHTDHVKHFGRSSVASRAMGKPGMNELFGLRANGEEFPIETSISRAQNGERQVFTVILRDITDRKQAEAEAHWRLDVLESSLNEIYIFDADTLLFDYVNECARINLGYSMDVMRRMTPLDLKPDFTERTFSEFIAPLRLHEKPKIIFETVHRRADGSIYPVEIHLQLVDRSGKSVFLAVINDITDRRRAEEALRESNEKFRQLADNITDVFWIRSLDLRKLYYISPAYEQIFGRSVESIYADPDKWVDFIHPEDREQLSRSFAELTEIGSGLDLEYRIVRPDGEIRWVRARGFPVRDASNTLIRYAGILTDITERKELEEQFQQSQKMEAVGQLAGGVAHDFNNLLTAITGYSELALRRLGAADPLRQNIEEIKNAGDRAAALTSQLLAFSRKQVLNPRVHNLNSVIWSIERMLRRIIRESIELRTFLDPDLGNIKADPGQMEQVVMNLVVNARDAMPGGGMLTIETQNCYLEDELASPHVTAQPGKYVKMIVSDSGEGMDEITARRIFEPFFTTKATGKGTGLGLSTVHGIIKQSGGNITVRSRIGVGTTFEVILPRVDEIEEKPKWIGDSHEDLSGTETILLVEDEEAVRNLARDILVNHGYNVLEAASGAAALSICDTYSEPIHILLTDVVMPRMSGTELKDQFVKLRPDAKVLLMSGYTDDLTVQTGNSGSETAFLEKPFTPDRLARKVREVLKAWIDP
jgi:PAS domain S-box-containing protein